MLKLYDGMLLYHGSYMEVKEIDLGRCEEGKDFGKGFYLTTSYKQAQHFVPLSVKKYNYAHRDAPIDLKDGRVSVYRLHLDADSLKEHYFQATDRAWLHFICGNRKQGLFKDQTKAFCSNDMIAGKIANDRTSTVISAYMAGAYGSLDDDMASEFAIRMLLPNKLDDQYCFLTQRAVAALEFLRSEPYDPSI